MDGTTGIVLAVIFGLVTLILGILNYINKRNEYDNGKLIKQTEFEIKLINIEKELLEIKAILIKSQEKYEKLECCHNELEKRVFVIENKRKKEGK